MTTPTSQTVTLANAPGDTPVTVTAAVVSVKRREQTGIYGPMVGLDARLHLTFPGDHDPHRYLLSRLLGEPYWVQDAHFGPNSYPYFSHGFGARYLKLRGIAPELEALLDQAAHQLGLVEAIGPDVPLARTAASANALAVDDVPEDVPVAPPTSMTLAEETGHA